jgi:hypothetical protein
LWTIVVHNWRSIVTAKTPDGSKERPVTLTDGDIDSRRALSRRSVLGGLGLGAGAAASVVFGAANDAFADAGSKKKKGKPKEEADAD